MYQRSEKYFVYLDEICNTCIISASVLLFDDDVKNSYLWQNRYILYKVRDIYTMWFGFFFTLVGVWGGYNNDLFFRPSQCCFHINTQRMITFKRVISRVGKIALDVWPHAPHLLSCIARCRWIIICFILLYNISNELNYIILPMVGRLLKKQLISLSVQILNGIVLSLLSLVLLSYFHWKLSVLFFLVLPLSSMSLLFFWHEYYHYP